MKIYLIAVSLTQTGWNFKQNEIEVNETPLCYVAKGKRINKLSLEKIDTMLLPSHKIFNYFSYCLEGRQDHIQNLMTDGIKSLVKKVKEELDCILKYI